MEVRLAYLPAGGAPKVWRTRSVKADEQYIYLLPPAGEWSFPADEPITVYVIGDEMSADFDSPIVMTSDGNDVLFTVERPPSLTWKSAEVNLTAHQKRKYLRVEVALPCHIGMVVQTPAGRMARVTDGRGRMINLSVEGCQMLLEEEPLPDHPIDIKVLGAAFPLHVQGRTVRVKPHAGQMIPFNYNVAISFSNLSSVSRDLIGRYIVERQKESI